MFTSDRAGTQDFYRTTLGGASESLLFKNPGNATATSWSPDGKLLVYQMIAPEVSDSRGRDVWVRSLESNAKPTPLVALPGSQNQGQVSPDGRWLAYSSDDTGIQQVYVQPFRSAGARVSLSTTGGRDPRWRHDGKELFYVAPDGSMMAVQVTLGSSFMASVSRPLFTARIAPQGAGGSSRYDMTQDGQRFIVDEIVEMDVAPSFTVVLNWAAGLKK